jgi:putative thioredoxin
METCVSINANNAKQYLIDESMIRPVLVDFWADWCAPCKTLMPLLERLATEYAGAFLLAKLNADEQRMIASQFGVQSLPTVILMKDGQPIDGFVGAKTEVEIRQFLDQHLPKAWDGQFAEAQALMAQGDYAAAVSLLRQAQLDSAGRVDIVCALAECLIHLKRLDEATGLLTQIRLVDRDARYQQVHAQLELANNAQKAPEITELEAQLALDPDNSSVAHQLALQYSQHAYEKEALELLFSLLKKNLQAEDGAVRRTYADILATLPKGDPLAVTYQRKLYALLY